MVSPETSDRLLLRAEVVYQGRTTVTRTTDVSMSLVTLPVPQLPPLGARVQVRLSFPLLVTAFEFSGTVKSHHRGDGPGDSPSITVEIDHDASTVRAQLAQLLARPTHSQPPALSEPTYHILIVEDNTMIRDMFAYGVQKYFKKRNGVTVDLATDGEEAWKMLNDSSYDLAIVDHYLPAMNGAQLISQVRNDARLCELPVVAISVGGDEAREASIAAGADLFLDKPVVLRDLFATLDRLTTRPELP
ncbi:MAG: hypothetical protein NVS3B20_18600 [Polyangiales bacterium]